METFWNALGAVWHAIQAFIDNHPIWTGIIGSIVVGYPFAVWAGHHGNKVTERNNRETLKAKQHQFIKELSRVGAKYLTTPPKDEEEVAERRTTIAEAVKRLSNQLFDDEDTPPIETVRPEETKYDPMNCKWCRRMHEAHGGTQGKCTNCGLPLDYWIGSQGITQ
ncbi:MAG: hypothetical protein M3362_01225 [Acidobacteriota bacterium]|nr:hypothetical protein [Acidobacteriota bacterium]